MSVTADLKYNSCAIVRLKQKKKNQKNISTTPALFLNKKRVANHVLAHIEI